MDIEKVLGQAFLSCQRMIAPKVFICTSSGNQNIANFGQ